MKFFSDWFTENDNSTSCPLRALFIVSVLVYMLYTLHDLWSVKDFAFMTNAKDWASGLAELLGFGGTAIAAKSFTEKP
ncbi:hypothetical protein BH10PLA2_BH10PLA2_00840 [soil metagenome]